ncbi:MAG: Anaerobic nitric oxide reductase transcription regulator NorR [Syntrophus sp. SKADARSKE-3]|nr:Anaerobic nitric oxide reductase transcription regulator NorR [Syntrophus sp. SKADARSKE-3]
MKIDENDFFHQMTTRICSSLDIDTALQRSLSYLGRFMPADAVFLHLYEQSMGAIKTIAQVTASGIKALELITPLSREGRESFEKPGVENVRIVNNPENDPVIGRIAGTFHMLNSSSLVMRLVIEGERIGSLVLTADGLDRYTEEHAHLLTLLNEPFGIALSNALAYQEVIKLKEMLADDNRYLHDELLRLSGDEIVGSDFGLKEVMDMVQKVAPLDSPVLLLGETGVGKGVIAGVIHQLSPRRKGPFITVNSGAIPETLLDSELFGHEKGAFTGAFEQKRGRFERADHGTIFIDEIGELQPQAQIRMLRVLQDKIIERVGGTKAIPVDIRIIAATHRNLQEMVHSNRFREDLWFRINVFPVRVPPLRERKGDIPSLVYHFIGKKVKELKLPASPELAHNAIDRLMNYHWPGNVRELENLVEREMILNSKGPLSFNVLETDEKCGGPPSAVQYETGGLDKMMARHIREAMKAANGVVHGPKGAASLLGINPSTLRSRMKKLHIPYGKSLQKQIHPSER